MPDSGLTMAPLAAQLHGMNMSCQAFHPKDGQYRLPPIFFGLSPCSTKAITLLVAACALLAAGCRTVYQSEVPTKTYPRPPVALSEFLKNPVDGIYSLPDVAAIPAEYFIHNILVVTGGIAHLSRFQDGRIGTNSLDLTEFRPSLPTEEVFQQFGRATTDSEIERVLGKPTHREISAIRFIGLQTANPKTSCWSWFSVSPSSHLEFMNVRIAYTKSNGGRWTVSNLSWDKHGGRRFFSEKDNVANGSPPIRTATNSMSPAASSRR